VTIFAAGFGHCTFREGGIRSGEAWLEEGWKGVEFIWLKTVPYKKNDWRREANRVRDF